MSTDLFTLFNPPLPTFDDWHEAAAKIGYYLRFSLEGPITSHGGTYLPVTYRDQATGFEFVASADGEDFAESYGDVAGVSGFVYCAAFNIRTGPGEFPAALVLAQISM